MTHARRSHFAAAVALTVVALALGFAVPRAEAGGSGVGFASIGFAKVQQDSAPGGSVGFGVGALYRLASPPIGFGAEAAYLLLGTVNRTATFTAGSTYAEVTLHEVPITAQFYYFFPRSIESQIYADAGAGVYATTTRSSAQVLQPQDSVYGTRQRTVTDFGMNGGGGISFGRRETGLTFGLDGRVHRVMATPTAFWLYTFAVRVFFD